MKTEHCYWAAALIVSLEIVDCAQADSTIQFSAPTYTFAESTAFVAITVESLGGTNTFVSVNYATADGTATNGLKYSEASGTLTFGSGETNKTFLVPILNDGLVQGTKTFQLMLTNPSVGAVLGTRTNATARITDNDVGIRFQFATNSVAEDAGTVLITIVRGDDGILPVSVDFFTTDLTGKSGLDYTGATNTLSFAPQERLKLLPVQILNNSQKQPNRTFRVTLANPVGASLGSQRTATVTIVDNDQGFQFESANYTIAEDAGAVRLSVLRGTDDTNFPVTVDVATSDLTATSSLDYIGVTNTLSFAPGERLKPVTIAILNDRVKEPTKSFRVALSNPTGGAALGLPSTATVKILDNDPGVGFELSTYSVSENEGVITVTVLRGNDVDLVPIAVDYATSNLTAIAGQDYQPVSGTLAFNQNETIKSITVPILRDATVKSSTRFALHLSNPTGGALLGTSYTTVNILDATGLGTSRIVAPPFDTALTVRREGDLNILSWSGGGQLQRADRPAGPWQSLTTATNPYTVQSQIPTTFYRVTRPRPANLYIPSSYDSQTPVPLVTLLHEYGTIGADAEAYMPFRPLAEARGFLYCYPDSPRDRWGNPFWNATDACCDFGSSGVDDVGYLRGLVTEIRRQFAVDQKRIYLIGHSNGGHMAYGMACQSADLIAGIASLAGMTFMNPSQRLPSEPVNILHIHAIADEIVPYAGGADTTGNPAFDSPANMPPFPGAVRDIQTWAAYNGASGPVTDPAPSLDLTTDVAGPDTVKTRYTNSPPGGAVELWTINGGSHSPTLSSQFSTLVIDWLLAHPKP